MSERPPEVSKATRRVIDLIGRSRLPMSDEKVLQVAIERLFRDNGVAVEREVKVAGGIIDFLAGNVGIEVKIEGPAREVHRQLTGYAAEPRIEHLVLVAAFPCSMPPVIGDKPCTVVNLGRAWL